MSDAARAIAPTFDPTFWNLSAPSWDAEFRAWAAPLLKLSAEQAGLAVIVIGQLIECAWRLRRINTTMATDANLTDRDQCRALAEAQRAFSRAHTDYQRWVLHLERERERAGAPGGRVPGAEVRRSPGALGAREGRGVADSAPSTQTQAVPQQPEASDSNGSTHINDLVVNGALGPVSRVASALARLDPRRRRRAVERALKRLRA